MDVVAYKNENTSNDNGQISLNTNPNTPYRQKIFHCQIAF